MTGSVFVGLRSSIDQVCVRVPTSDSQYSTEQSQIVQINIKPNKLDEIGGIMYNVLEEIGWTEM